MNGRKKMALGKQKVLPRRNKFGIPKCWNLERDKPLICTRVA